MRVTAFGLGNESERVRYDDLFAACPHAFIQQSTLWAEVIKDIGPDEPIFLLAERNGEAVGGLPLYLYRGPAGNLLTSVPQAGPLGGVFLRAGEPAAPVYAALLGEAARLSRTHDCLALTLITNPFEDDLALYREYLAPELVLENFTQVMPMESAARDGEFILPNSIDPNIRRHIRKSIASGYSVRPAIAKSDFVNWYSVHIERHTEIGATPLDQSLLSSIAGELVACERGLFLVVEKAGVVRGGCLLVLHRRIADVFILSTGTSAAREGVNYLLIKDALILLERRGVHFLNWQSSPRRGDGVYNFKKQWGSEETLYYFVTKLNCPPERIRALGSEGIRRGYPGHFVVPFGVFESGFAQKLHRKA